jgi:hypothetical protein
MKSRSQTFAATHDASRHDADDSKIERLSAHGGRDPKRQGQKRQGEWLDDELRRQYKSVLDEPVPDALLSILREADDEADEERGDEPAGGPSGRGEA